MVQLIKTDKAADRPEIKTRVILIPMSIQIRKMCVRVPGLGWSGMLSLGGCTEVSSSNCEVTKGLQLAQPKGFTRSGKDNATRVKRRRQG